MNKGKKLYEGKAKIIYEGPEKGTGIQHFKDDATAFNNLKKSTVEGKGVLNNRISEHILNNLNQIGVKTHLIKRLNMREQLIKLCNIFPVEFIVRNIATGSLTKRLGIEEGTVIEKPLLEYCLKNDELGDPLISREHILTFNWLDTKELDLIVQVQLPFIASLTLNGRRGRDISLASELQEDLRVCFHLLLNKYFLRLFLIEKLINHINNPQN